MREGTIRGLFKGWNAVWYRYHSHDEGPGTFFKNYFQVWVLLLVDANPTLSQKFASHLPGSFVSDERITNNSNPKWTRMG